MVQVEIQDGNKIIDLNLRGNIKMKKIKEFFIMVVLFIVMSVFLCGKVNAHSVEIDPEDYISMPWFENGSITIYEQEKYKYHPHGDV